MALAVAVTAAAAPTRSPVPRAIEAAPNAPFAPGEAIVRFEPGTGPSDRRSARSAAGVDFERGIAIPRAQVVAVDGAVKAAIERLERQPDIAYAQPNYRYQATAVEPNDPLFPQLWGLSDFAEPDRGVDALAAWEATTGAGQVIAVVDTGVDLRHPDIQQNLWSNPGETADGKTDGDGNEKDGDLHGYDFVDLDSDPDDYNDHGTHVAGTAAAAAGNGLGIAGVAPDAQIMAVRVLDGAGSGWTDDIAAGIRYAALEGADVINLSLGGPAGEGDQEMANAVAAARTEGAVVVAAAGNEGVDNDVEPHSPCVLPGPTDGQPLDNLICVAAIDSAGSRAGFSNWGSTTVHVGAPGVQIRSTVADYYTRFIERFESGLPGWTVESPWATTDEHASQGSYSFADSPGGNYLANTDIEAVGQAIDLSTETDCRMRFDLRLDTENITDAAGNYVDRLLAGADAGSGFSGVQVSGWTRGWFAFIEFPIAAAAGRASVTPVLRFESNGSDQRDGAHVDDLRLLCRDGVYGSDNYASWGGTSMAAPHVAGVVALARAAAIDAGADSGAQAIVGSVLEGVNSIPDLEGDTVTGGMVDACLAVGEARGTPSDCSGTTSSPEPEPDPAPEPDPTPELESGPDPTTEFEESDAPSGDETGTAPDDGTSTSPAEDAESGSLTTQEPALAPLARPNLRRSPRVARVRRSGRFAYAFLAPRAVRGRLVLRTARPVLVTRSKPARSRHVRIAIRRFVVNDRRRVVLRSRLSRRERRILRLNGRLVLRVAVRIRAADGRTAGATRRLVLLQPRR